MVVNVGQAAVFLNQFSCTLGAYACHAGDIVGGVALNGLDINHLAGRYAVFLFDAGFVVNRDLRLSEFGSGQTDTDMGGHQLQAVPVPGGNEAFVAGVLTGFGKGPQNVVSLEALALDEGITQIRQQFLQCGHLLGQLGRHSLALCLVSGIHLVAEGGGFQVKGNGHGVGLGFVLELLEHGHKAVNAVGKQAVFGGKKLHTVKSPVDNTVSVQNQQFHGIPPCI